MRASEPHHTLYKCIKILQHPRPTLSHQLSGKHLILYDRKGWGGGKPVLPFDKFLGSNPQKVAFLCFWHLMECMVDSGIQSLSKVGEKTHLITDIQKALLIRTESALDGLHTTLIKCFPCFQVETDILKITN